MSRADAPPIERIFAPLREFLDRTVAGGVLLLGAALVALVWSNSPWSASYFELWSTPLTLSLAGYTLSLSLHDWINDGLMALFFLVVGLEIKRELLVGELASKRRAVFPVAAAIGGALLPALIYIVIVGIGRPETAGWGVPMATDIAFALGVLALLGSRIPLGLRIFVAALAIADDLLAVLVIAIFYTSDLSMTWLAVAAGIVALLLLANRLGARRPAVYGLLGVALWFAVLNSGVHATVAGVLLALTIPARQRVSDSDFARHARELIDDFEQGSARAPQERYSSLWDLESITEKAQAPMLRLEHSLTPFVAFFVVPLFALANAGVTLSTEFGALLREPVVLGIFFGLIIGKQIGITAVAWLVVRAGLASLPAGVGWRQIYGAAWLCGIGFTMSLFIAYLAFGESATLALAKQGILAASVVAGVVGYLLLRRTSPPVDGSTAVEGAATR
ncbi:MAG TPA: Na+/H+ antiporter NhaA [Candidatus Limnocylindrales bacterium]|nr:Na+/H+ antiporter NhaA [Candidatus Limnocylindrales bacterium]